MDADAIYVNSTERLAPYQLAKAVEETAAAIDKRYDRIAVVCIGTDRSTGDSYGPLVGQLLSLFTIFNYDLYGTLKKPVHALTLEETMEQIDTARTLVIGVDACLGIPGHIGCISVSARPILPGAGLGKDLPPVGDMSIAGIVAMGGMIPFQLLQCAPLGMVYTMAEQTAQAIRSLLYKRQYGGKPKNYFAKTRMAGTL